MSLKRLALALALALREEAALAQTGSAEPLVIPLELSGCESLDQAELRELLVIEFRTLRVQREREDERVRVVCSAERAQVTLEPSQTTRDVQFAGTAPAAWPRLLALAVSELVVDAAVRPPRAVEAPPPMAVQPGPSPLPTPRMERVRILLNASWQRPLRARVNLWGPELALEWIASARVSLGVNVLARVGKADNELAQVRFSEEGAALFALWELGTQHVRFGVGPGLSLVYLRLVPEVSVADATGHTLSGPWGGAELGARAALPLGPLLLLSARTSAGLTLLPVAGRASDGRSLVDSSGLWLAAALGVGARF